MPQDFQVSVVVPVFNRAHLIAETLDSILGQTLRPAEVFVVDDGSTDDTAAVLRRYGGAVRSITIASSGVQVARNTGVEAGTAPWIALCDSDDVWRPQYLEHAAPGARRTWSTPGASWPGCQPATWCSPTRANSRPRPRRQSASSTRRQPDS
jgi:glycosyltransferase involved in cell wall biosynthesis